MVHKPSPVQKMQSDAARKRKRDANLRHYGTVYPPGEVGRSLIALGVMVIAFAAIALIAVAR